MRVALFSDVHGNLTALEAVLRSIDGQGCDLLIFAGDLCLYGPRPNACADILRGRHMLGVYGNTDDWLLGRQDPPERFGEMAQWTAAQLSEPNRAWLTNLPFSVTINPTAAARTGLQVVHANPQDVNQVIYPDEADQLVRFGEVQQTGNELSVVLEGFDAGVLAYGHLHIPSIRPWNDHVLVNVSSVSLPRDNDPRAKYALLNWQGAGWLAEHVYVPYDLTSEIAAYKQTNMPGWEDAAIALKTTSSIH